VCRSGTTPSGPRRPGRVRTSWRIAHSEIVVTSISIVVKSPPPVRAMVRPRGTFTIESDRGHLKVKLLRFNRKAGATPLARVGEPLDGI